MSADLDGLAGFVAVAEERSFTRAAVRLGVSTSAPSHAMRGLEERLGVRLLARVGPAMGDIRAALDGIGRLRERPAGRLRLVMPRIAASMVLLPRLARFARQYPDVVLDVTTDNGPVDIVAARFDAGIEIGEFIHQPAGLSALIEALRYRARGSPASPLPTRPRSRAGR